MDDILSHLSNHKREEKMKLTIVAVAAVASLIAIYKHNTNNYICSAQCAQYVQ